MLAESLKRHLGGEQHEECQEPEEDTDIPERGKRKRGQDSDSSSSDSQSDSGTNEQPSESLCFN